MSQSSQKEGTSIKRLADTGLPDFEDESLSNAFRSLQGSIQEEVVRFRQELEGPHTELLVETLERFRGTALSGLERLERALRDDSTSSERRALVEALQNDVVDWLGKRVEALIGDLEELEGEHQVTSYLSAVEETCEEPPTLDVKTDPAQDDVTPADRCGGRWLRRLRRARLRALRVLGRDVGRSRHVPTGDLAVYFIAGPAGRLFDTASNGLHVQQLDLLRKLRLLLSQFGAITDEILSAFSETEGTPQSQIVAARTELNEEFGVVVRELQRTGDRVLSQLGRRLGELVAECGHAALLAGTWELPARRYRRTRALEVRSKHRTELHQNQQRWRLLVRAAASALTLRLEGAGFVHAFNDLWRACADAVAAGATSVAEEHAQQVAKACRSCLGRVEAAFSASPNDPENLEHLLRAEFDSLDGAITDGAVREVSAVLDPQVIRRPFDDFFEAVERVLVELPESYLTQPLPWEALPEDEAPPDAALEEFPFRELAREVMEDEVRLGLYDLQKAILVSLRDWVTDMSDVARYLSFSFEAAWKALDADEGDVDIDLARELAVTGLKECLDRVDRLARQSSEQKLRAPEEIARVVEKQAQLFADILARVDFSEARRRSGLPEVGAQVLDAPMERESALPTSAVRSVVSERLVEPVSALVRRVRTAVGLQYVERVRLEDLTAVATFDRFAELGVPSSYRRLFETAAFGVEDILAGQEAEIAQVQAAVARWTDGHPTALIIVGERGGGRTTLVERAIRQFLAGYPVQRRRLTERLTSENELAVALSTLILDQNLTQMVAVEKKLQQQRTRTVVALEEIQYLMLRTSRGLKPLEAFLDFVSRPDPQLFWVVTVDAASWRFMDTFMDAAESFSHVVELGPLTRKGTEQLILRRHQVSGFALETRLKQTETASSEGRIAEAAAQERYFDALYQLAGGHPVMTMFHWLSSIVDVQPDQTVIISWPPSDVSHWVQRLGADRLFLLAAVMMHGTLTEQEFAAVARMSRDKARARLGQLQSLNLLEQVPGKSERYAINQLLRQALFDGLRERNIL